MLTVKALADTFEGVKITMSVAGVGSEMRGDYVDRVDVWPAGAETLEVF